MIGLYGPERLQYASGGPVTFTPIYVMIAGTHTPAILYGDAPGATTVANPIYTDQYGELTFFAELGDYDLYDNNVLIASVTISDPVPGSYARSNYHHSQPTPQMEWMCIHNLGYPPGGIVARESTGDFITFGLKENTSIYSVLTYAAPTAGGADFS